MTPEGHKRMSEGGKKSNMGYFGYLKLQGKEDKIREAQLKAAESRRGKK